MFWDVIGNHQSKATQTIVYIVSRVTLGPTRDYYSIIFFSHFVRCQISASTPSLDKISICLRMPKPFQRDGRMGCGGVGGKGDGYFHFLIMKYHTGVFSLVIDDVIQLSLIDRLDNDVVSTPPSAPISKLESRNKKCVIHIILQSSFSQKWILWYFAIR